MRKILVTGGTGFIGSWVVDALKEQGDEPLVFDHHNRQGLTDVETFYGDIRDDVSVTEAVAHADGVIHLAAVLGTQETIANPRPAAHTNILGSLNVFSAVHQYDIPAVYIAVGNHWMNNTYSISKTAAERFAFMFNQETGTRIAVVRALNAFGPGQEPTAPWGTAKVRKIMPSFVCKALAGDPIEVYGSGEQVMDMIYVEDVAKILVAALTVDHGVYDTVIEAGSGRPTTVNDIALSVIDEVETQTGMRGELSHLPMRPGEPEMSIVLGDPNTLLPLDIHPHSLMTLEDAMERTVTHFRTNYFPDIP